MNSFSRKEKKKHVREQKEPDTTKIESGTVWENLEGNMPFQIMGDSFMWVESSSYYIPVQLPKNFAR